MYIYLVLVRCSSTIYIYIIYVHRTSTRYESTKGRLGYTIQGSIYIYVLCTRTSYYLCTCMYCNSFLREVPIACDKKFAPNALQIDHRVQESTGMYNVHRTSYEYIHSTSTYSVHTGRYVRSWYDVRCIHVLCTYKVVLVHTDMYDVHTCTCMEEFR